MIPTKLKSIIKTAISAASSGWKPYSRLILSGDRAGWVLDWEMRELRDIAMKLGIRVVPQFWNFSARPQSVFLASQFFLCNDDWLSTPHRVGFSFFHGLPNTVDNNFDSLYSGLCRNHNRIDRIQVSHTQMREAVLQTGIDPAKVHLIPIGINLSFFDFHDRAPTVNMSGHKMPPQPIPDRQGPFKIHATSSLQHS